MPKKIKWIGSLTHEIKGVVKLVRNEEVTLEDDVVRQLPKSGYILLRSIKATESDTEGDEGRFEGPKAPTTINISGETDNKDPEDGNPTDASQPETPLNENLGTAEEGSAIGEDEELGSKLPEESDTDEVLTEKQEAYYKETTLKDMMKKAGESGIDIPSFLKSKSDVFRFLIDNGFKIGE